MTPRAASPAAVRTPLGPALIVLYAVVCLNLIGFGLAVPLLPFFAESLNAPAWQVTLMFSAYSVGQFFAELIWGRLSDRIGRKPVLMITISANVLGYVALAFAPNIWAAVAIRLFTGLGAGNISTIQGYVADVTPPAERAGRMGLLGAAFGLGFVIGPTLGGFLAQPEAGHLGFRLPLFVAAGLSAAAATGVLLFVRESRAKAAPGAPRQRFLAGLHDARANPVISRVLLVTCTYMAAFAGMESTFGLWAKAGFDWGPREVGMVFGVVGVVGAFTQALLTGRLTRRFGEARVLAFGMGLFGLSLFLQTLHHSPWLVPVLVGFGVFGQSLAMPSISALISRSTAPDRQGAMLGLNMAAGSFARIFGPGVAGALFSGFGAHAPFWLGAALTVPAMALALNAGRAFRREQEARAAA